MPSKNKSSIGLPKNMTPDDAYIQGLADQEEMDRKEVLELNKLLIPIYPLREYLAELTLAGIEEIPAGALFLEVRRLYREKDG